MIEVKLRVPKRVDAWFRARGYDEREYEKMSWAALAGEMDYLDREGTKELRQLLQELGK